MENEQNDNNNNKLIFYHIHSYKKDSFSDKSLFFAFSLNVCAAVCAVHVKGGECKRAQKSKKGK